MEIIERSSCMFHIDECILYRNFSHGDILTDMTHALSICCKEPEAPEKSKNLFYSCMNRLVEMANDYGFCGDLWTHYLTWLLVNHENAFSVSCEITGLTHSPSLNALALHDFTIFKDLFHLDFSAFESFYGVSSCCHLISDYQTEHPRGLYVNERISSRISALSNLLENSASPEEFMEHIVDFYKDFGVGKLGLHKAFRLEHKNPTQAVEIIPITRVAHVNLDDLIGYELEKKKLTDNTEAFLEGKPANNCLLFGDAGTGKSTCIKAILNQYYEKGLRIIEVYKHQFRDLSDVIAQIKNRNYKFIIYMDDLSFEDFEIEYKYLKAIIEGGLEKKPNNVLIYATSNRRHLIRESFNDKNEYNNDLHTNDTVQEKLSLVSRFGITIYFGAPEKKEFQNIVLTLAKRQEIPLQEDEILAKANIWELQHGGHSGRTAQQFIDYLQGMSN